MNRCVLLFLVIGTLFAAFGCTVQPFRSQSDLIRPLRDSSVYLHSSIDGTDMVLFGSPDPLFVVSSSDPRTLLVGKVLTDGSTKLHHGTYELDATGHGVFHLSTIYTLDNESTLNIAAREGATRTDFGVPYDYPLTVSQTPTGLSVQIDFSWGSSDHTYTSLDDVMAAIDTAGATAHADAFQLYNFSLFLSQVRIPAFGGLGMTRYITSPERFAGIIAGSLEVSVESISMPTSVLAYQGFEDLRGLFVDGSITSIVDINGDGPMQGAVSYELRNLGDPRDVLLSGTVDYAGITLDDGIAVAGDYAVTIDGIPGAVMIPYTAGMQVDLTNILPVTP